MSILYILCGVPGSGKTHWAHNFLKTHPEVQYVSRDAIRFKLLEANDDYFAKEKKVFDIFSTQITTILRSGQSVIADATHISVPSRAKLVNSIINRGLTLEDFSIEFIFINTTLEQCIKNNELRTDSEYVPKSVLKRMWYQFEPPTINEFKNCIGVITVCQ